MLVLSETMDIWNGCQGKRGELVPTSYLGYLANSRKNQWDSVHIKVWLPYNISFQSRMYTSRMYTFVERIPKTPYLATRLYSSLHGFINFCGFVFVKIPQNRYVYFPERKCVENIFFLLFSALSGRIFLSQNFLFISFFFFDCSVIFETNQQEKMFVQ